MRPDRIYGAADVCNYHKFNGKYFSGKEGKKGEIENGRKILFTDLRNL